MGVYLQRIEDIMILSWSNRVMTPRLDINFAAAPALRILVPKNILMAFHVTHYLCLARSAAVTATTSSYHSLTNPRWTVFNAVSLFVAAAHSERISSEYQLITDSERDETLLFRVISALDASLAAFTFLGLSCTALGLSANRWSAFSFVIYLFSFLLSRSGSWQGLELSRFCPLFWPWCMLAAVCFCVADWLMFLRGWVDPPHTWHQCF